MTQLAYPGVELQEAYRGIDGDRGYKISNVFGAASSAADSPQVFLVDVVPGWHIRPHHHDVPQFQVVVRGGGRMGHHEFAAPYVHFADGRTAYGPLEAGQHGMSFFTIRASADTGAHYMPEERERLAARPRGRQEQAALRPYGTVPAATCEHVCVELRPDGLSASDIDLAPGASIPPDGVPGQVRRLLLVLEGSVARGGTNYPPYSWFSDADGSTELRAGGQGARLLRLTLPG